MRMKVLTSLTQLESEHQMEDQGQEQRRDPSASLTVSRLPLTNREVQSVTHLVSTIAMMGLECLLPFKKSDLLLPCSSM